MNKLIIFSVLALALVGCDKNISDKNIVKSQDSINETWKVISYKDEMRGTTSKWLNLKSDNSADLDSPYNGDNRLQLDIIDSKSSNPKIFIAIDKGQYDCSQSQCSTAVKFGNNPVQYLTFEVQDTPGSDGKILAFKDNPQAFLKNIRAFKNIVIELPFFRNGTRQFHFNTSGFNEAEKNI